MKVAVIGCGNVSKMHFKALNENPETEIAAVADIKPERADAKACEFGARAYYDFDELIEPLRDLFKDEVRKVGLELGIPEELVWRQPFPGPGLAVRILGDITQEKLDILKDADAIFREEIKKAGLERSINQYFAVLTDVCSVGVMGDGRTYENVLALRSVTTKDFMTAEWTRIPYEVLDRVSVRIVNEVPRINRIVYDITSKPPATVEWE